MIKITVIILIITVFTCIHEHFVPTNINNYESAFEASYLYTLLLSNALFYEIR